MLTDDTASSGPTGASADDPLSAFVAAMHGAVDLPGSEAPPAGLPIPVITLSNGLSVDAGVAQLVSALASLPDGNSAFNTTPFAAASEQDASAVIAPET
jgi:hypothetical protein